MVRRFLVVSAGVFLLALSLYLGASRVGAQGAGFRVVGDGLVESSGTVYRLQAGVGWVPLGGMPISASQAAWVIEDGSHNAYEAITVDGEGWVREDVVGWVNHGLIPGAPTPARSESWGQLKARYAPSHAPTSQTQTNR